MIGGYGYILGDYTCVYRTHSRLYQNFPKASMVFCISVWAFSAMAA